MAALPEGEPAFVVDVYEARRLVEKDGGEIVAGTPYVPNASVLGVVDAEIQGPKIRVFKKKRRKGYRRTQGHRSILTRIRVKDIIVK